MTLYNVEDPVIVEAGPLRSPFRPIPISPLADDLFCASPNLSTPSSTSSGQFLAGDIRFPTAYTLRIGESLHCKVACTKRYTDKQKQNLIALIDAGYRSSLFLDGVPLGTLYATTINSSELVPGFEIGFVRNSAHFVRNNVEFTIYLGGSEGHLFVGGFDLTGANSNSNPTCFAKAPVESSIENSTEIAFTFSVKFETISNGTESVRASRFVYVNPAIAHHVFMTSAACIALSILVVLLVLYKAIWKDGQRSGNEFDEFDGYEWKLIHADVFRPPLKANTLCLLIGWGTQLVIAFVLLLAVGLDNTDLLSLGSVLDGLFRAFLLAGPFGGLFSGRFFKTVGDGNWRGFLLKAGALPPLAFAVLAVLAAVAARDSNSAVTIPIRWVVGYSALNFVLTGFGVLVGFKLPVFSLAQNVNRLPRQIPPISYVKSTLLPYVIAAVFVYASPAANVHNLMVAAWTRDPLLVDVSSLLANLIALIIESILCGVVITFWKLSNEDYRWWWPAFKSAGSAAVVFFLYGVFFWRTLWTPFDFLATLVYFLVIGALAVLFGLCVGSMSFIGSFAFVQLIYNALKME